MQGPTRSFASDNNSGVLPQVMDALAAANRDHVLAYGDDVFTQRAREAMQRALGGEPEVHFVFNGTGANVLGIQTMVKSYHAVVCTSWAHIAMDECGAPEKHLGTKLIPIPTPDGKLTPALVAAHIHGVGNEHHAQPKVISITQSTELGTVYRPAEIRALADFAHERGMYLHMDGARIANAAAALGVPLRAITSEAGVDVLSFGGTKNGMMFGEAVAIFRPELARDFKFLRKQGMQLASKMRFVSCQFEAMLKDETWRKSAEHANAMARILGERAARIPGVVLARPVEANAVFAILPPRAIADLQKLWLFYTWDEARHEVRWVCSFDTTQADIDAFVADLHAVVASHR